MPAISEVEHMRRMRDEGRDRIVAPVYGNLPDGPMREKLQEEVGAILTLGGESTLELLTDGLDLKAMVEPVDLYGHGRALKGEVIVDLEGMRNTHNMTYREQIAALRMRERALAQKGIRGVRAVMASVADCAAIEKQWGWFPAQVRTSDTPFVGLSATYGPTGAGVATIPLRGTGVEMLPLIVSSRGVPLPSRVQVQHVQPWRRTPGAPEVKISKV